MKKTTIILLLTMLPCCSTPREDVVFEAFSEPFLDWYSLKLYSTGEFDLHIPAIDYKGTYTHSGDTIFLRSVETEERTMSVTVDGERTEKIIGEKRWTWLISPDRKKIMTIGDERSTSIDILSCDICKTTNQN